MSLFLLPGPGALTLISRPFLGELGEVVGGGDPTGHFFCIFYFLGVPLYQPITVCGNIIGAGILTRDIVGIIYIATSSGGTCSAVESGYLGKHIFSTDYRVAQSRRSSGSYYVSDMP